MGDNTIKRAALYIRVSTIEQKKHGYSVDSQLNALEEYCAQKGYKVVNVYNDAGLSANKSYKHRPALLDMINDCQKGIIDIVLFTKLDRFFRNVPDYYACIEQMNNVPWQAIWEDYETVTSSGKFKVNIMLSIAQAESDRTSERIKAVKEYQRSIGNFVGGTAPMGYKIEGSQLLINEDEKELVTLIFDTFLKTKSVARTLEHLRNIGSTRSRHGLYLMLKHPVYAGDYNGYKCEPYITWEQHEEIVNAIDSKVKYRHEKSDQVYMFSGLLKCSCCGKTMSGTYSKRKRANGNYVKYHYYRCIRWMQQLCDNKFNISERKVEQILLNNLDNEFELYKQRIEQQNIQEIKHDTEDKIKQLEAKLQRIGNRYEDGDITREEYREKRDQIKREINGLQSVATPIAKNLPINWKDIYNELDETHKKQFWDNIIDKIVVGKDIQSIKIVI